MSGAVGRPGVYEIPMGAALSPVLTSAGADLTAVDAVLVGGYFGTWIPGGLVGGVELETESLAKFGAAFGYGLSLYCPMERVGWLRLLASPGGFPIRMPDSAGRA